MYIQKTINAFWKWFDENRHRISFLNRVEDTERENILIDLFEAIQKVYEGLNFSVRIDEAGDMAYLYIHDDGTIKAIWWADRLLKEEPSFRGWTFDRKTGNPALEGLPDLTDMLPFLEEVWIEPLAVQLVDKTSGFLLVLTVPRRFTADERSQIEVMVRFLLGADRFQKLITGIVFTVPGSRPGKHAVSLPRLEEWSPKVQPSRLEMIQAFPMFGDN